MGTVLMLRDQVTLRKETILNVSLLNWIQPMPAELSRLIFKENALEKPTKVLFNQLSYYLLSIIDSNVSASMTWPLYDTKDERAYRTELAKFISDNSSKGLLSPVMSSYLVNPGCFKVIKLTFQLSQLAIHRMLQTKMKKDSQKELYAQITEKYKNHDQDLTERIEKETLAMQSKFSCYLYKRKTMEEIAGLFRKKITQMEEKLSSTGAQNYINNLVNSFLENHDVDEETKNELLDVKDIEKQPIIFDVCLRHFDTCIDHMEGTWNTKVSSLLQSCRTVYQSTEALVARSTGESDPRTYTVEYNHKTDEICTKDLQNNANSEQKYVLKNLVKDDCLNFPNLIRAFVISVSFIMKQNEIGDEIYNFNECLGRKNYSEMVTAMKVLIKKMLDTEAKLPPTPVLYNYSLSIDELPEIPPSLDLSTLTAKVDSNKVLYDAYTPLNLARNRFNLRTRAAARSFVKPQPKSLITPFHKSLRYDFLKVPHDQQTLRDVHNVSTKSNINSAHDPDMSVISTANRTIETNLEGSSVFTKQQILRLLSTKKSSSSKKNKFRTERPNIKIKKGSMFNESNTSNESKILFRSHSSPNLCENSRYIFKARNRQLSIMPDTSHSPILEMSGIAALNSEINYSMSQEFGNAESSRIVADTSSMPSIVIKPDSEGRINNFLNMDCDLGSGMDIENMISPILEVPRKSAEHKDRLEVRNETPKANANLISKTSSLEKIINRFQKVRANIQPEKKLELDEFKVMVDQKVINSGNSDLLSVNRNLLPDLLSLNCSGSPDNINANHLEHDKVKSKKCRISLGTALGVDENFLDEFDLID